MILMLKSYQKYVLIFSLLALCIPAGLVAQPKVLTPGKMKISESEPSEDLNGNPIAPPLEAREGIIRIVLDPELEKFYDLETVARWFRESRITIDQLNFDRNVSARRDGSILFRFTYTFITGQDEITRRIQIKRDDLFSNYFQSHKIYRQRITTFTLGVNEAPVLEKEAKGTVSLAGNDLEDIEIEAIGSNGVPLKFFEPVFELPTGTFNLSITKTGFNRFRKRITVAAGQTLEMTVDLKRTPGQVAVQPAVPAVPAVSALKFKEEGLNRLQSVRTFTARRPVVRGAIHPDGLILATAHADNTIYLWDISKGQPVNILPGHGSEIVELIFYPGKSLLFSVSETHIIGFNLSTGKPQFTVQQRDIQRSGIKSAVYLPEKNMVAALGKDNSIRIWDIAQRKEFLNIPEQASINRLVPVAEMNGYAALTSGGLLKIKTGINTSGRQLNAEGNLMKAFVSRNGKYLVAGSEDIVFINNAVSIFDITSQGSNPVATFKASAALAYFDNGFLIGAENSSRTLSAFDASSGSLIYSAKNITVGEKLALLSPDGKRFITEGTGNDILVYELGGLREWQAIFEFSEAYNRAISELNNATAAKKRLQKEAGRFLNRAAKKKYEDITGSTLANIINEGNASLQQLKAAQLLFVLGLKQLEAGLLPQQTIEARADYEKRIDATLENLSKAQTEYREAEGASLSATKRAVLKSVVFELANESTGIPVKTGEYNTVTESLPVTVGALQTFVKVSAAQVPEIKKILASKNPVQVQLSDVSVSPVTHRIYLGEPQNPVFPGDDSLSFQLPNDKLFTNLFTMDLKASGNVSLVLTDKKSTIEAVAIKDGVSFTKVLPGDQKPVSFRPGLYEITVLSKKNKPVERWALYVEPGSSQTLTFNQIGSTKPSAAVVFQGDQFPYTVNIALPNKKMLAYTIWSSRQVLDLPKGAYGFSFSKSGYEVTGKNSIVLAPGMKEEIPLTFRKLEEGQKAVVQGPVVQAQPKGTAKTKEISGKKKGGSLKWVLLLAAAGGGAGYYLSQSGSGAPATLPVPPGRPN